MPSTESSTALLVLDFQVGPTEKPFGATAVVKATQAVEAARRQGLLVGYRRVGFRAGYPDVASWNPVLGPYAAQNLLPVGAKELAPEISPAEAEPVVAFLHAENEDPPTRDRPQGCLRRPDDQPHDTLVEHLFARSAVVTTVDDWQPS